MSSNTGSSINLTKALTFSTFLVLIFALLSPYLASFELEENSRGMLGPFCLETIVTDQLEFKVFEISARIVAGSNPFVGGSPYSDINETRMSTGRRIARSIRKAADDDRLKDILS